MKRLLVLSVGLLASASVFGEAAPSTATAPAPTVKPEPGLVAAPTLVAPAPVVIEIPKTVSFECKPHLPYGDIASVMGDGTVHDIVKLVVDNPAFHLMDGDELVRIIEKLTTVVERMGRLDGEVCELVKKQAGDFANMVKCIKYPEAVRPVVKDASGRFVCKDLGVAGKRSAAMKVAIHQLRTMMEPIFEDLFLGYETEGGKKKIEGMIFTLLDIVGQSGAKDDLMKVNKVLNGILNVLKVLEKIIPDQPAQVVKAQPQATKN